MAGLDGELEELSIELWATTDPVAADDGDVTGTLLGSTLLAPLLRGESCGSVSDAPLHRPLPTHVPSAVGVVSADLPTLSFDFELQRATGRPGHDGTSPDALPERSGASSSDADRQVSASPTAEAATDG